MSAHWRYSRCLPNARVSQRAHCRGGEQQTLAIARCLMGAPALIMFDEPSLGLAPTIVRKVLDTIHELNTDGVTCLLVGKKPWRCR